MLCGTVRPRLGVLLALLAGCAGSIDPDVVHVGETRFLLDESRTPPAADQPGWQTRSLPDIWSAARRRDGTSGWYRATIDLAAAPPTLWAVYLPRVNMNAGVWVNGQFVGDGGRLDDPVSRNWNRPLLFTVPAGVLHTCSRECCCRHTSHRS